MSNLLKRNTVLKVKEFLVKNLLEIELIKLEETARSAQDAAKSLKKEVGAIVKSLLFKSVETNEYYLCLVSGDQYMSLDKSYEINDNILKITNKRTSSIISFNLPIYINLDSLKKLLNGQEIVKDIFENNKDTSDLFTFLIENALIDFSFHSFKK